MYPALDITPLMEEAFPELRLENQKPMGRKHAAHRQQEIIKILVTAFEKSRPHNFDENASTFSRDELTKRLRVGKDSGWVFLDGFSNWPTAEPLFACDSIEGQGLSSLFCLWH
jgi:hypothetical protein